MFISPFIDVLGYFSRLRGGIELKCEHETHGRYADRAPKQNKRHVIFLVIFSRKKFTFIRTYLLDVSFGDFQGKATNLPITIKYNRHSL